METSLNVYDYPDPPEDKHERKDVTVYVKYKVFDVVADMEETELIQEIRARLDDYLSDYSYDEYVEEVEL